jgi:hypothetical protein
MINSNNAAASAGITMAPTKAMDSPDHGPDAMVAASGINPMSGWSHSAASAIVIEISFVHRGEFVVDPASSSIDANAHAAIRRISRLVLFEMPFLFIGTSTPIQQLRIAIMLENGAVTVTDTPQFGDTFSNCGALKCLVAGGAWHCRCFTVHVHAILGRQQSCDRG